MGGIKKSSKDLVRLLYDGDKSVRNAAALELGRMGSEGFAAAFPLLSDKSWVIRYHACEIIGMTKQAGSFSALLKTLDDSHDHVRYMSVKGLGILGDPRALPKIIRMKGDKNPFVRRIVGNIVSELSKR